MANNFFQDENAPPPHKTPISLEKIFTPAEDAPQIQPTKNSKLIITLWSVSQLYRTVICLFTKMLVVFVEKNLNYALIIKFQKLKFGKLFLNLIDTLSIKLKSMFNQKTICLGFRNNFSQHFCLIVCKIPNHTCVQVQNVPLPGKMFASSSFYAKGLHPTVEDQVELARRISNSLSDISNKTSKGQSMYVNRKKRSVKWVHEGDGKSVGNREFCS